jgi:N-acetylmuramoyl-L-alanine amidase
LKKLLKIGIWKERLGLCLIAVLLGAQMFASGCGCGAGKTAEQAESEAVVAEVSVTESTEVSTETAETETAATVTEPETATENSESISETETVETETAESISEEENNEKASEHAADQKAAEDQATATQTADDQNAADNTSAADQTASNTDTAQNNESVQNNDTAQNNENTASDQTQVSDDTSATTDAVQIVTSSGVVTGGHIVCIDPGHQLRGDNTKEPNGPGSTVMKARVTGGTTGTTTGVPEYMLTLQIGLALQTELQNRGYTVYMTRTTHDVNISNVERAQFANNVGAEICIRLHADGANSSSANGASTLSPSSNNPYVSALAAQSYTLSSQVLSAYCNATGMKNRGVSLNDTMTGINWCLMPVTILEMGFMTNPTDDRNMQDPAYQAAMVQGIANGIDAYFGY